MRHTTLPVAPRSNVGVTGFVFPLVSTDELRTLAQPVGLIGEVVGVGKDNAREPALREAIGDCLSPARCLVVQFVSRGFH